MPHIIKRECDALGRPLPDVGISITDSTGNGSINTYSALIDTGATGTSVSQKVVEQCGLTLLGKAPILKTGGGPIQPDIVEFYLSLFPTAENSIGHEAWQVYVVGYQNVLSAPTDFDVILGRNILCCGEFRLQNCRTFEFIF